MGSCQSACCTRGLAPRRHGTILSESAQLRRRIYYNTCFVVVSVQVYDSSDLHFFLDGAQATSAADSGDMVIRPNELVIGKAGPGLGTRNQPINECKPRAILPVLRTRIRRVGLTCNCCWVDFLGMIDDVRLWARVLTTSEVLSLAGQ